MSKIVAQAVIRGAIKITKQAEEDLLKAISDKGESQKVEFPETAFYFPMANALLAAEVKTLGDARKILGHAKGLLPQEPSLHLWLPYLGSALDAGIATLLSEEIIVAVRYLYGTEPQPDCEGFFTDTIMRSLGIQLVDGRMPGFAAILGAAPDNKIALDIIRQLQERNILIFVGSSSNGRSIVDQLKEEEVQMGWDNYIVPYGRDTISAIYPLNWAIRSALTFGGLKPGQARKNLLYCKERVFAFGLALGLVDDEKYATGAGAINMGFPVIADTDIPEIHPTGITTYEALVKELDYKKIVPRCIEVRGVKVKVANIPIPVLYGAAFEGERVRKEQVFAEFGGKSSMAFEYLKSVDNDTINDGDTEVIGPDIDKLPEGSKSMPLAIVVEVSGRKMQKDFEPILERQIHHYINCAMGLMHVGQRDMNWIRINKDAAKKGFLLKHMGVILHAKLHEEYSAIIDKVSTKIYTKKEDVERLIAEAQKVYAERDERISGMTDESVDTFFSCTLCQSFAPNHVCVITPERLGLCGAYSWLDAKASFEIIPTGPNQPIEKGGPIDENLGQWKNVNDFFNAKSNKSIDRVSMYSIMDSPQTSCGCFECIVAIIPEANGVMVVHRDYSGMTPSGMNFTTLAGSVGGGVQTPGFLGVGKLYIASKKFISAEGGLPRLVWMPKELKDILADKLKKRSEELGMPDLLDKIADETNATSSEELLPYLEKVQHPALGLAALM
ncbi:MAG: CO dehydrogenase/CO-methylating acetyl-CoA synthase complex subunit beta [Candidatus Omnitrophica bacterium CG11_big_fil_rev_8_21_14_0_20_42_13]|uniref:CO-methylating acetyl-CoA synthase n=1 Tax=Candidatus Ghiorseimicrobium undicola TaxID=1974746 RepID=A0A2H0LWV9_9BACT|nr:MAG: CO dehydrogenase/CO-methylating acetyl-CoA synthase complex subunit beta [Candidatus Omnitrophica bacterium CG11_big_fil_rev_8_21_14_0_20_42_13]